MIKLNMVKAHLRAAFAYAETSYAERLQVGAVIVNQLTDQPVSAGWNGMPPGEPNVCEHMVNGVLESKPNVVHAEINAMLKIPSKLHREFLTLFVTDSPCPACASVILQSGIKTVVFGRRYRLDQGITMLLSNGVQVFHGHDVELKLDGSYILEHPAKYTSENILICKNYERSKQVEPHGLARFKRGLTNPEVHTILTMFDNYATVDQIAAAVDRTYGSICSLLTRRGLLSWADNQGYMASTVEGRKVWCGIEQINYNQKAIDQQLKYHEPMVKEYYAKLVGLDQDTAMNSLMQEFNFIAPFYLRRMCGFNK